MHDPRLRDFHHFSSGRVWLRATMFEFDGHEVVCVVQSERITNETVERRKCCNGQRKWSSVNGMRSTSDGAVLAPSVAVIGRQTEPKLRHKTSTRWHQLELISICTRRTKQIAWLACQCGWWPSCRSNIICCSLPSWRHAAKSFNQFLDKRATACCWLSQLPHQNTDQNRVTRPARAKRKQNRKDLLTIAVL